MKHLLLRLLLAALATLGLPALPVAAQVASPHAIDIPRWFTENFLDFKVSAQRTRLDDGRQVSSPAMPSSDAAAVHRHDWPAASAAARDCPSGRHAARAR